jgi:hypothetical protein
MSKRVMNVGFRFVTIQAAITIPPFCSRGVVSSVSARWVTAHSWASGSPQTTGSSNDCTRLSKLG